MNKNECALKVVKVNTVLQKHGILCYVSNLKSTIHIGYITNALYRNTQS